MYESRKISHSLTNGVLKDMDYINMDMWVGVVCGVKETCQYTFPISG